MAENKLYFGDNLDILRRYVKDETADLIYLDPPFNSNQNYNVLFAEHNGSRSSAQFHAFVRNGDRHHFLYAGIGRMLRRSWTSFRAPRNDGIAGCR